MKRDVPTAHNEEVAASILELLAPSVLGQHLGERRPRDARDGSGLWVDFTYDDCQPAIAVEATAIYPPGERALWSAVRKRLRPVAEVVEHEKLGQWTVALSARADIARLAPELIALVREGRTLVVGQCRSVDLPSDKRAAASVVARHRQLKKLGLECLEREGGGAHGLVIAAASGSESRMVGLTEAVAACLRDNAKKLGETGRRQRHLAVLIDDFQISRRPEVSPPPEIPDEINYLWVIHTWPREEDIHPEVWIARRGSREWRVETWRHALLSAP